MSTTATRRRARPDVDLATTPPSGYKRTDLGALPENWKVVEVRDLKPFVTSGSRGWARFYTETGAAFIRITNLSRESIYLDLRDLKVVRLPPNASVEAARTGLRDGDLLISITADIGIIGFVDASLEKPAFINQHIALVRFDDAIASNRFIAYYLASEKPQRLFVASMDVGAKAGMNLTTIRKIRLALPPSYEQRAIAEALSGVDGLLRALEALIAKKRAIKLAAMQQLLTGKTRLPGFNGEWETKRLADICSLKSGQGITSAKIDDHSAYPCYGGNGLRGFTTTFTHQGDYALIGRQGALCGNVVGVSGKFYASEHALVVTPKPTIDIRWLTFVLGRMNLNQYSESSAQPGLSATKLLVLEIDSPPTKLEQAAIAAVLSDMDAEISALEQRRDKSRAIKQGMMQQLLTGRIRLAMPATAKEAAC